MPTGYAILPLNGATFPDASGAGNTPASPAREISGASQTANSPKVTQVVWDFDAAVDEHVFWAFILPGNYQSGGKLRLHYKMLSAVAGNVVWKAAAAIAVLENTDDGALVFDAVVTAVSVVPGTQGQEKEVELTLTMTNAAANRKIVAMVGRDADHASDTAAGDARLTGATFEYVTA